MVGKHRKQFFGQQLSGKLARPQPRLSRNGDDRRDQKLTLPLLISLALGILPMRISSLL